MKVPAVLTASFVLASHAILPAAPRSVSGIYPHLAMFNGQGECGTGAVVPWAGRLWVVTYAPHNPNGSDDKLYEISPDLTQTIRPESIGGTPANRMIHPESSQLFIGPYAIDSHSRVRTIPHTAMFGRLTGLARHLTDPAGKIVYATMEEGFYEVDVRTLAVTELWADEQKSTGRHADLPGYHGKGFSSGQGRYVYANNGDHAEAAKRDPAVPSGALAEWDGQSDQWTIVRRNQFTDVTGPGGITGSQPGDPLWTIGWDHRSLILMLLDHGKWQAFRLPKSSHCYDGAHGWNTEWPRIRDIGGPDLLMTMHGSFWKFPHTFSATNSAGIAPHSTYLKVIGDFCQWQDRLVFGCDDSAKNEFLNKHPLKDPLAGPGQSQSNLWFLSPDQLDSLGPALGRGALWLHDPVKAGAASDPFLLNGFPRQSLHLSQTGDQPLKLLLEVDRDGNGTWTAAREITIPPQGSTWTAFTETGAWFRLIPQQSCASLTAMVHASAADPRPATADPIFDGLGTGSPTTGVLHARGAEFKTLRFISNGAAHDLDATLTLTKTSDPEGTAWTAKNAAIPPTLLNADHASAYYLDPGGIRWRFPMGTLTPGARVCREVSTERNLLNAFGTFYEMPAENAGGFPKIRPIATHNRAIHDYAGYRGLLVMSGVSAHAPASDHIIRGNDGQTALWVGAIDDLWRLGKPRGKGGPWNNTTVKTGQTSDPYLATGFDKKHLSLSHNSPSPVAFRLEADFTGTGDYQSVETLTAPAGQPLEYSFPPEFGAYWLRLTPLAATTATATFTWE